jgi:hypothetical protein
MVRWIPPRGQTPAQVAVGFHLPLLTLPATLSINTASQRLISPLTQAHEYVISKEELLNKDGYSSKTSEDATDSAGYVYYDRVLFISLSGFALASSENIL